MFILYLMFTAVRDIRYKRRKASIADLEKLNKQMEAENEESHNNISNKGLPIFILS